MVCIDGLEDSSSPVKAATTTQTIEEATSVSAQPTETQPVLVKDSEVDFFSTGSEVMDDILEHSQQRMLEAFAHLSERIDGLAARPPASRSATGQPTTDIGYVLLPVVHHDLDQHTYEQHCIRSFANQDRNYRNPPTRLHGNHDPTPENRKSMGPRST